MSIQKYVFYFAELMISVRTIHTLNDLSLERVFHVPFFVML